MDPTVLHIAAFLALAAAVSAPAGAQKAGKGTPTLAERFANPRSERRMLRIYHGWSTVDADREKAVQSLRDQGFGGAVTNVSFDNGYTGDEGNFDALKSGIEKMHRAGLSMWLYDEAGYPSGRAGTLVLREHPELEVCGLLVAQHTTDGGAVSLKLPPGKLMYAGALPTTGGAMDLAHAVDLSASVNGGVLAWTAPAGSWRVVAITEDRLFDGTQIATSGAPEKTPYVSLLNPRTTEEFLRLTHDRYAAHLGNDLGRHFVSTFTDEPSSLAIWFAPMPYGVLPWSTNLAGEFARRRGYELRPLLPALVADAGPRGQKVRYDYWHTVADLMVGSFFEPIKQWCAKHDVPSGGHLLLEENILNHVACYGDAFACFRAMDAPGIDALSMDPKVPRYTGLNCMGADVPWDAARMASSAAELEGKLHVMCEATDFHQSVLNPNIRLTAGEFRGAFNRMMLGGINSFNTYYGGFGAWTNEQMRELNLWIGRCCEMTTGGIRRADIAVLYPIETAWTRYTPSTHWVTQIGQGARDVELVSREIADGLFEARREFAYIDTRTLLEAKVDPGALTFRDHRWRVVVLPVVDTLPEAAWEKLRQFAMSGGVVVSVGAEPTNTDKDFPSARASAIGEELFGIGDGARARALPGGGLAAYLPTSGHLAALLDGVLAQDVATTGPASLRVGHRFVEGHEVYFLVNDGPNAWEGTVTLAVRGSGELWDPATGKMTPLASGKAIALKLGPYEGVFARFKGRVAPKRMTPSGTVAGVPVEGAAR